MKDSNKDSSNSLVKSEEEEQRNGLSRINNIPAVRQIYPITASIVAGYLVAPYVSTITRYGFPYFYGTITGTMPEDLGYLEYGSIYLPMQEHAVNFAYQNSNMISMTAGVVVYSLAKLSYSVTRFTISSASKMASSLGSSLYSFFCNKDDPELNEDEFLPESSPSTQL